SIQQLRQLTADNPNHQRRIDTLEPLIGQKFAELDSTIQLRRTKGVDAALKVVLTDQGKIYMDQIRKVDADMDKEATDLLTVRDKDAQQKAETTKDVILIGTLFGFVASLIGAIVLSLNIAAPLRKVSAAAEKVATGDLNVNLVTTSRNDEVGTLTRSFSAMVKGLRELNLEIREGVSVLASSASEILATTTQVAAAASETATAVSQTTSTVEEIKQTAQVASEKARYVSDTAQKSTQVSHTGKKSVDETIACMHRISEQMELIGEGIVRLSEQGQAIGEIMASVNDLAEQSNLLAVNASIEAAKAGEHGKGFAVVAQEVRSLAQQSKQATAQVRTILSDFQKATSAAVMAAEQGSKAVDSGVKQSGEASEAIRVLADSISEAAQAAAQIAASIQQQRVGMDQVAMAMESIKQASLQNVSSTKQGEAAAKNLHTLGQRMKQLVQQYQV